MNLKPLLIVPPLVLGVAGFIWMKQPDKAVPQPVPETSVAVRVQAVSPETIVATATGYGRVEAVHEWTAVSEIQGRISTLSEGLAEGTIVEAGQVLLAVDQTDYRLTIRKVEANIAAAEAQLAELERQLINTQTALEVEERILAVAQDEFDRVSGLVDRGTSTQAALDTAQKGLLAQENVVTKSRNTLALFPAQRAAAEAALAVRRAELAEAERSLEKSTISAPFRGRVSAVNIEQGQFIRTGDKLLTVEGTEAVEIVAEVQPGAFSPFIQATLGRVFRPEVEVDSSRVVDFLKAAGVKAVVQLKLADFDASYAADLVRFRGTIDSETGTLGLVVRVDHPLMANRQDAQPPLSVGSFVSVQLQSPPIEGVIAIPRAALQQDDDGANFVYLVDDEDRLEMRPVVTGGILDDRVMIRTGLSGGDRLILGSPRPPIAGMKLTPVAVGGGN